LNAQTWQFYFILYRYVVAAGAVLQFTTSALKLITAANLTNWGTATVQGSTVEIEKSGLFANYGNLTVLGAVNVLIFFPPSPISSVP
jgi:hypothetical protein